MQLLPCEFSGQSFLAVYFSCARFRPLARRLSLRLRKLHKLNHLHNLRRGRRRHASTQEPDAKAPNDEIVSHDSPATFKVRVNVVLVRVVVRDNNGKVVSNLKKEDFQLADERKPQIISSFSVETPASHVPTVKMESAEAASEGTPVKAADLPQRFVTLFFDDLHLSLQDAMFSRQATAKLFAAMGPRDRFAIFTTSGQVEQDFTGDRGKLEEAVQRILPHSLAQNSPADCPPMTLYEAYMIVDASDPSAIQVAIQDYMNCSGNSPETQARPRRNRNTVAAAAAERY